MTRELAVSQLGTIPYADAWQVQREIAEQRRQDLIPDTLLLLEHPHTFTFGRRSREEHLLWGRDELRARGIDLFDADRGGDITYHGPGQLVGYPILKRQAARSEAILYLRRLEDALLLAVERLDVPAERKQGCSGVWIGDEKVCAIGVKVDAYGVTLHGFALNVATDLSYFSGIVPCGIREGGVTSLDRVLQRRLRMQDVVRTVMESFASTFDYHVLSHGSLATGWASVGT